MPAIQIASDKATHAATKKKTVYLDAATTSWPKAPGVIEAVDTALRQPPAADGGDTAVSGSALLFECRRKLAMLLGISDPERIVLTTNATQALFFAVAALNLNNGDRVLTTCAEHYAVLHPLFRLREQKRIHLKILHPNAAGDIDPQEFAEELKHRTRLVVLTHASHVTGHIFDIRSLFAMAKATGAITLLDAAQTIGQLPVWPKELNADLVAFSGHKALRGPAGTGGLYVAPYMDLQPLLAGAIGALADQELPPRLQQIGLEAGTPNLAGFAGLTEALHWREHSDAQFHKKGAHLAGCLREGLLQIPGVTVYGSEAADPRLGIVSFRVAGQEVPQTAAYLAGCNIICSAGLHCAPLLHKHLRTWPAGTLRFSMSGANTRADVDAALEAVREAVQQPA
jgi:cysteine desulfurase / selenocysteine lyase